MKCSRSQTRKYLYPSLWLTVTASILVPNRIDANPCLRRWCRTWEESLKSRRPAGTWKKATGVNTTAWRTTLRNSWKTATVTCSRSCRISSGIISTMKGSPAAVHVSTQRLPADLAKSGNHGVNIVVVSAGELVAVPPHFSQDLILHHLGSSPRKSQDKRSFSS